MRPTILWLPLLLLSAAIQAEPLTISASDWAKPRSGDALVRHPALSAAAGKLLESPEAKLQIRYPGGDEGSLWALEVEAWLVALGFASERIEPIPGGALADALELTITAPGEQGR